MEYIIGCFIIFGGPALTISGIVLLCDGDSSGIPLLIIGLILIAIMAGCIIYGLVAGSPKKNSNDSSTQEQTYLNTKTQKATSIYNKCVEKGIYEIDDESSIAALRIIAETYGITDIEKAKAAFEKGRETDNKIQLAKDKAQLKQHRLEDEKIFKEQFDKTTLLGKQKYAGNNKANLERIKDKLIDSNNAEEKFESLNFSNFNYTLTEGKNLLFTCDGACHKVFQLLGSPAALDGSVKISVFNGTGKEIGCGYYSARGFNQLNLQAVGFEFSFNVSAMCIINEIPDKSTGKSLGETYTFKISPVHLWLIEK